MKTIKKLWHILILYLLLSVYIGVCLFACLLHYHEPDCDFHDNCPACLWERQSQSDFSEIISILDAIRYPIFSVECNTIDESKNQSKHFIFRSSNLSRAPPVSIY